MQKELLLPWLLKYINYENTKRPCIILSGLLSTKETPKTQTKVHMPSKCLPVEIQFVNYKQGLSLSGTYALPP